MKKSYRTKYKEFIMKYLEDHQEHRFCAQDIYETMRQENMSINLATVYRHLDRLIEEGILIKYKTSHDDSSYYQYAGSNRDCSHHLHLQCKNCGKVIHLECEFMDEINRHLKGVHGFLLDCKGSMLVGLCEDCRKKIGVISHA